MTRLALVLAALAVLAAGCGGSDASDEEKTLTIAVNAPFSKTPYVGETIADGAELAASSASVDAKGTRYKFRIKRYDTGLSARTRGRQRAARDRGGAVAIVDEGTGVDASWRLARDADIPLSVTYHGGQGLVDPIKTRPTSSASRRRPRAFLPARRVPDPEEAEGRDPHRRHGLRAGGRARRSTDAFAREPRIGRGPDPDPVEARPISRRRSSRRGARSATALLVWAQPATIAEALIAARSVGLGRAVYTPPAAEDPLVRQELAGHPDWVDGLTFASGRMTAENGPGAVPGFQSALRGSSSARSTSASRRPTARR